MRIYYNSLLKKITSIPVSYHRRAYGLIKKRITNDTGSLNVTLEHVSYDYDNTIDRSIQSTNVSDVSTIQNDIDRVNSNGVLKSSDLYYFPTDTTINTGSLKDVDYYYVPTDSTETTRSLKEVDYYFVPTDSTETSRSLKEVDYYYIPTDSSSINIKLTSTTKFETEIDKSDTGIKLSSVDYTPVNFDSGSTNTKLSSVDYTPVNFDSGSNQENLSSISHDSVTFDVGSNQENLSTIELIDPQIDASTSNEAVKDISLIDPQIDVSTEKETIRDISLIDPQIDIASNSVDININKFEPEIDRATNKVSVQNVTIIPELDTAALRQIISTISNINASIDTSPLSMSIIINYELAEVDKNQLNIAIGGLSYTTKSINDTSDDAIHNVGLSSDIDPSSRVNFNPSSFKNYVRQINEILYLTGSVLTSSTVNYTDDLEFTVISRHQSERYKDNMDYNIPYRASFVTKNWPYYTYDTASNYNLPALLNASDTILLASKDIWITASFENGSDVFTDEWGFAIDL